MNVPLITQAEVAWVCSKNDIYITNPLCLSGVEICSQLNTLDSECPSSPQSLCQPVNTKYPKTKVDYQRTFRPAWCSQFVWLHYLPNSDSIICHTCATTNLKGLLHLDTRSESSFLSDGFRNWKNYLQTNGFHKHESSLCHKHAITMLLNQVTLMSSRKSG